MLEQPVCSSSSRLVSTFRRRKVLTKRELLEQTGCSSMTAWRLLRQHGYHTSYNGNARHYTLVGVPQFDEHGLWADHDVRFSRWGRSSKPSWPWWSTVPRD